MPITVNVDADAGRGRERELVADGRAEVLRELGADDDVDRPHVVAAGDDLLRQRDHVEVGFGLDADDRDRLGRVAAPREAGTGDDGRNADHVGHAHDLGANLLPLVDRAQLLRARLDLRRDRACPPARSGRATWSGARIWIGAWKLSVRRTMFACIPAEQRRHEDDDAAAERDAEDDEQRLRQALAHEAERDDRFEERERVHRRSLPATARRARAGRA